MMATAVYYPGVQATAMMQQQQSQQINPLDTKPFWKFNTTEISNWIRQLTPGIPNTGGMLYPKAISITSTTTPEEKVAMEDEYRSKLIVGISNGDNHKGMVLNACCVEKVDAVVTAAPEKITLSFMKMYGIDFVVCKAGQTLVSNEVLSARKCLIISEDGAYANVLESKGGKEM